MFIINSISIRNIVAIHWENPGIISREEFLEKILPITNDNRLINLNKLNQFLGFPKIKKILEIIATSPEHQAILENDVLKKEPGNSIFILYDDETKKRPISCFTVVSQ